MQIIIPMSGIGKRFQDAGYKTIKPLIEVESRPFIAHVIGLFPGNHDFIFICNQDHINQTNLESILKNLVPASKIVTIDPHKLGPVYAVLQAEKHIVNNQPTIVNYCDFSAQWNYLEFQKMTQNSGCDGAVTGYIGFHPHLLNPGFYAGMRVDKNMLMDEIREKFSFTDNLMESYQSTGTYYFKSGSLLKNYFTELIQSQQTLNGEYYVSMVYPLMLKDKCKIKAFEVESFCQWGTPEDLAEYTYWSEYFHKKFIVGSKHG